MAEVLATAASIIAVIQITASVASLCYGYMNGAERAPDNIQRFMSELKLLTTVLSNLQISAHDNPEVTTLWDLEDPIKSCIEEMGSLKAKLGSRKRWLGRLQWPLDEKETMEYIWRIERLKSHFMLALSVDQQVRTKVIEKHVEGITGGIQDLKDGAAAQQSSDTRTKAINWLYPEATDKRHVQIRNRRRKNTGKWVLSAPEVQSWLENRRLLLGYGIPGAGKTFLSSLMIDHLQELASVEKYGVAYIYFNFKEQDQQRTVDALASLVKQLACQIPHLPKEIENLYKSLSEEQERPTLNDLYSLLLVTTKYFTKTFIVCDALDECGPESQRGELLPLLHRMEENGMSLFLTSREYPEDIQDSFQNSAKIKLWAKDEDITLYIEQKIDSNPRAKRIVGEAKCKDRIVSELIDCAKGMFLLVHFHIEFLCKQTTVRQILKGLESLKESSYGDSPLSPTYDRAMEILRAQPRGCVDLALNTLSWLVKARRVLTVSELQMALSVEPDQTDFDANNLPDRKTMLDVCASFVTVDEDTDTVRLAHYSVQEYLLKNSIIPPGAELKLAIACTTFLSFDVFSEGRCEPYSDRRDSYPLLDYAAKQLHFHLKECDESSTTESVLRFLGKLGSISSFYQASSVSGGDGGTPHGAGRCSLHLAADLGHCSVARLLLESTKVMVLDKTGATALQIAAYRGHESMAQLLLENGADISTVDDNKETALFKAASEGHEPVVRLLLKNGANVLVVRNDGETALSYAAYNGHEPAVRLLLGDGADISTADNNGWTALHNAACRGHEPVVRVLIENGADISAADHDGATTLHKAAYGGYEPVVQLLLGNGAEASAVNDKKETVLFEAASRGHESVVRLLLKNGASVLPARNDGETALHQAASRGDKPIVQLLLGNGAEASAVNDEGETILFKAASGGHESVVRLLLKNGASVLPARNDGETALHQAAYGGYEPVVQLLLGNGAEASAVSINGETVLFKAASGGHESVVRLLLKNGASVLPARNDGETALHQAAYGGYEPVVQLLLGNGAEALAVNDKKETVLFKAASGGHESVVRLLLKNGASVLPARNDGETALHQAASRGDKPVVQLLLGNSAEASAVSINGETVLFKAASGGHESVVRLLLKNGASVLPARNDGETALHQAAYEGHELVVQLLLGNGAEALAVNDEKETVLFKAASGGHESVVRLLLNNGASVLPARNDGETALSYASLYGHEPVVRLLLENGADISAADNSGWTALHNAAIRGHEPVARVLIENGADISSAKSDGKTALHIASSGDYEPLVRLLLEKGAEISAVDSNGKIALHHAISKDCQSVVRLLIEKGAEPVIEKVM